MRDFMFKLRMAVLITTLVCPVASAQPPVRKYDDKGAPPFKVLKEGESPPLDAYDNFVIGPKYAPAPERKKVEGVPEGRVEQFEIDSKETKLFNPGIARKEFGKVDPKNLKTLIVETHAIDYKRKIGVYIPAGYKEGTETPFMVVHDGPGQAAGYKTIIDNLIAQKRIPPIVLIAIQNGGGDAQGHERGKEYDNMNGDYATYIEDEVLPRVEKYCKVKLTKDPDGRAAMGSSSGGSAALIMAWFRNDLYHRVLTTSGTFVNQAWPFDEKYPDGAWGFHRTLIPNNPKKPIRFFISVGDKDSFNPNVMRDDMHDWVEANHRMAKVLKEKGYEYQYLFCLGQGHGIGNAQQQFLPHAIEWVWKGYAPKKDK
jgi:iron(III)-enterobactin esterase